MHSAASNILVFIWGTTGGIQAQLLSKSLADGSLRGLNVRAATPVVFYFKGNESSIVHFLDERLGSR